MRHPLVIFGLVDSIFLAWYIAESLRLGRMEKRRVTVTHIHMRRVRSAGLALVVSVATSVIAIVSLQV